jgi:DNA primase
MVQPMSMFEIIKQRVQILDVVQEYTALKKAGGYWKGRCPFHHEKTASFTVSPDRGIFYCFGCHTSGDVVAFVARAENLSGQRDAARFLAEKFRIDLPNDGEAPTYTLQEKERYFKIHELTAAWAHAQLKQQAHKEPRAYLHERGFTQKTIDQYTVGFFPGGSGIKALCAELKKHNFLAQDLVDCNILAQNKNLYYSPFEERILFPIKDPMGRACGFGGRIYKKHDDRPKYYNTKESDFFIKGSLLFGFDEAKKSIQAAQAVFMVEGYTDCLAMAQHGFSNTVATLGTACTQNHLKVLSRHADLLYVLYDADAAGTQAILRLTQLCWQVSMELRVVRLPQGTDPALYLASGGTLAQYVSDAKDIFLFYVETIGPAFNSAPLGRKIETLRTLLEAIAGIQDPLKRDLVIYQASQALGVPTALLTAELRRTRREGGNEAKSHPPSLENELWRGVTPKLPSKGELSIQAQPSELSSATQLEKKLSCAILHVTDILDARSIAYVIRYMPQPLAEYVRTVIAMADQGVKDPFKLFYAKQAPNVQKALSELICSYEPAVSQEAAQALFGQWQRLQWRRIVADIKEKIAEATIQRDMATVQNLINEFNRLKSEMVHGV